MLPRPSTPAWAAPLPSARPACSNGASVERKVSKWGYTGRMLEESRAKRINELPSRTSAYFRAEVQKMRRTHPGKDETVLQWLEQWLELIENDGSSSIGVEEYLRDLLRRLTPPPKARRVAKSVGPRGRRMDRGRRRDRR